MVNKVKELPKEDFNSSSREGQLSESISWELRSKMHKISPEKQVRINNILQEMKCSTERMEHLLAVFNRINRGA